MKMKIYKPSIKVYKPTMKIYKPMILLFNREEYILEVYQFKLQATIVMLRTPFEGGPGNKHRALDASFTQVRHLLDN